MGESLHHRLRVALAFAPECGIIFLYDNGRSVSYADGPVGGAGGDARYS